MLWVGSTPEIAGNTGRQNVIKIQAEKINLIKSVNNTNLIIAIFFDVAVSIIFDILMNELKQIRSARL